MRNITRKQLWITMAVALLIIAAMAGSSLLAGGNGCPVTKGGCCAQVTPPAGCPMVNGKAPANGCPRCNACTMGKITGIDKAAGTVTIKLAPEAANKLGDIKVGDSICMMSAAKCGACCTDKTGKSTCPMQQNGACPACPKK
ncbi:MAG: hypothetical protein ABFD54_15250 [Armatimonadota bacterium]|nr:hypothetical protein [bacterium]